MPCKAIPCIVNSTYILLNPRNNIPPSVDMLETKTQIEQENKTVWTKKDLWLSTNQDTGGSSYGRGEPEGHSKMTNKSLTFRDIKRVLPRPFSTHGSFGTVIEECEPTSTSDDLRESPNRFSRSTIHNSEAPRRYSTSSWPSVAFMKESQRKREVSDAKTFHRRRQSEVIISDSKVFGLVGYRNESLCILNEQRSANHNSTRNVSKRENESDINPQQDSSFRVMSSAGSLEDTVSSRSSPRRFSQPVNTYIHNYKTPGDQSTKRDGSLREYRFDNDTELQWQKLVARAKSLQFTSPSRKPEIVLSGLPEKNSEQVPIDAKETAGDRENGADTRKDATSMDDNNNNQVTLRRRRRSNERRYSLRMVATLGRLDEGQTKSTCDYNVIPVEKNVPRKTVTEERCVVSPVDAATNRRHSVAVVRPVQQLKERVSGYSTHGALEYAKMLMEKIQEEGKTKSKKERLEEMSKVLKLVLEELNRIETPDRDLVSLFISLRAKMVNLRTELKADEVETKMETEKESKDRNDTQTLSSGLSKQDHVPKDIATHRRFSWI